MSDKSRTFPPLLLRAGDVKEMISTDGARMEIHCQSSQAVLDLLLAVDRMLADYRFAKLIAHTSPVQVLTPQLTEKLNELEFLHRHLPLTVLQEMAEYKQTTGD